MTKSLLQNWMTLDRAQLQKAHQAELDRTKGAELDLEERQLLDAAHSRLITWKEPLAKRRGTTMTNDDDANADAGGDAAAANAAAIETKAKKAKRSAPAVAKVEEKTVAKKAKAKKTKTKKAAPAKKASTGNGERIPADAKIVAVKGKQNPFKEGSGAHERTELVLKNSGKTREAIEKLKGIMTSTVPNLVKAGVVRVA